MDESDDHDLISRVECQRTIAKNKQHDLRHLNLITYGVAGGRGACVSSSSACVRAC